MFLVPLFNLCDWKWDIGEGGGIRRVSEGRMSKYWTT